MLTRRAWLGSALLAGAWALPGGAWQARAQDAFGGMRGSLDATHEGLLLGASDDQTEAFSRALRKAAANGQPLFLPPGRYQVREIDLPPYAHLIGVPGQSILAFRGGGFMLRARGAAVLRMEGLVVDGAGLPLDPSARGLLDAEAVDDLVLDDCTFLESAAAGANLRSCAGRVERSRFSAARTIGLRLDQSRAMAATGNVVFDCGNTGILVERDDESADDTIVSGNRVSAIRADSGGTGPYGNGINVSKANGVIVSGNRVDGCAFSAVRFFSSDNIQATDNVMTRCGEVGLFVEFASQGAVVSGNLIDGAVGGISFANFAEHGGRLGVCSGNIVRNIRSGPRYADGVPQIGIGIGAEADVAITGNVVDNCVHGLQIGWGPYLRNVTATGNVIRGAEIGISVSVVEGGGPAVIADNVISATERGAILGMRWEEIATRELAGPDAEAFPQLTIAGNRAG